MIFYTSATKKRWVFRFNGELRNIGNYCIVLNYFQAVLPEPSDFISVEYCKKVIHVNADDLIYGNSYKKQQLNEIVIFLNADAYDFIKVHEKLVVSKPYPFYEIA